MMLPFERRNWRTFYAAVLGILILLAQGCATTSRPEASPGVDRAIVQGIHEFHWRVWYKLGVDKVDGKSADLYWYSDWAKPVPVEPGARVIRARCLFALEDSKTQEVSVELPVTLQAGRHYQLRNGIESNAVVFWVEDMQTRSPAGRKVTVATTPSTSSPSEVVVGNAALVLLRVLLFIGTGQ
jgi:hypothetical protein